MATTNEREENNEQIFEKIRKGMREEYGAETIDKMIACYNYYKQDEEFLGQVDIPVDLGDAELFIGALLTHRIHPVMYEDPMDQDVLALQLSIMNMTQNLLFLDAVLENKKVLNAVDKTFKTMIGLMQTELDKLKEQGN